LLGRIRRITTRALAEQGAENDPAVVIDVRTEQEWEMGHIGGSVNIPLHELQNRLAEVPKDAHIVVHCQGGYRSSLAASLLQQQGRTNVTDMVGGFAAWKASRLPVDGAAFASGCSTGCSI
jgi:rhodanese-related sulfurtransferase